MNTLRFASLNDTFALLDLVARVAFKTQSSISFSLERYSKSLLPVRQVGWIDVHHPCNGHIKLQIRISLPAEYHEPEQLKAMIHAIMAALEIADDETYETHLFVSTALMGMGQPINRDGFTDKI